MSIKFFEFEFEFELQYWHKKVGYHIYIIHIKAIMGYLIYMK